MLTPEELIFANAYLTNGRDEISAFLTVYPDKNKSSALRAHGQRFLNKLPVQKYIQTFTQSLEQLPQDPIESMVQITKEMALGQVNLYDKTGMPITEMTPDGVHAVVTQEVKPSDRLKAAEMLLRLEGKFEKDNKQKASKVLNISDMDDEKLNEMLSALRERHQLPSPTINSDSSNIEEAQIVTD